MSTRKSPGKSSWLLSSAAHILALLSHTPQDSLRPLLAHTLFLQTTVGSKMLYKLQPGRWAEHLLLPVECGSRQLVLDKLV